MTKKEKIAISIDKPTREMVDAMVDGLTIRSRSQAIEFLISKGIEHQYIRDAVILVRSDHAQMLLRTIDGKSLITHQLTWLSTHGIRDVHIVIGETKLISQIQESCAHIPANTRVNVNIILDKKESGTVPALNLLRHELKRNFIVLLGDTLNEFDLTKMIIFHLKHDRLATVGLISTANPKNYSTVDLEGDRIIEFRKKDSESHIIDAGIYAFKPAIFNLFKQIAGKQLDRDIFPTLCKTNDIKGYFTFGKYTHLGTPLMTATVEMTRKTAKPFYADRKR